MTEPEDSTSASQPQASPYAPPPMISEVASAAPASPTLVMPIPVTLVVIYSAVATALTMFLVMAINNVLPNEFGLLILASPIFAMAGFVAMFFLTADINGPVAAISLSWKTLMVCLVPLASMICFVPTCVGSTIFLMPIITRGMNEFGLAIPIFIAYTATCFIVVYRLRSRIVRRSLKIEPNDSQITIGASTDSPFSVPDVRKPE
jgi:hypothetical protein